jgi:hypothetical protein
MPLFSASRSNPEGVLSTTWHMISHLKDLKASESGGEKLEYLKN